MIARQIKGLAATIGMTVVDPVRDERGWAFRDGPNHSSDPINGFSFLSEAYHATDPRFAKYPRQPVVRCEGFRPIDSGDDPSAGDRADGALD